MPLAPGHLSGSDFERSSANESPTSIQLRQRAGVAAGELRTRTDAFKKVIDASSQERRTTLGPG